MVEQGYPNFRFDTIVVEHTEGKTTVNVLLYFTTGHRYRYGSVHIVYDTAVAAKSHVAARVVLAQLYIDSGNWYKLSEIERSEAALYKLGTFDLVRVALDTSYLRTQDSLGDSAAVPIEVYLRMRQRAEVPIGVFAGTTGSQGITIGGNVGFTDRNLSQIADNFNFQLSAQPLPSTQQRYAVNIDYRLPYIGLGRIPLAIGLGASRQFQTVPPDYDQRNISAHVGSSIVLSKLDSRTTLSPDVLLEYLTTITGDSTIHATAPAQQVNLLPSIGYQNDRTNDPINPTGGSLISVSLEYGVPSDLFAMFGDTTPSSAYLRLSPQVKLYYDLSSTGQMILATRLRAGLTKLQDPSDPRRIPSLNHRFFGGGASSNRGWGEQSLIVSNDPHWDASEGGFSDIDGNLEIRFAPWQYTQEFTSWEKLSSPIRFVLFYDIGNVWDNSFYDPWALNFNRFAQTIGLGLRYNLFFGPIRIDCGFKLYDPSGRFSTETHAITQADQGAWLFSHRPLIAIGRTFNWSFAIGQAF
jgi:outer membrane protein assembly factor BamA